MMLFRVGTTEKNVPFIAGEVGDSSDQHTAVFALDCLTNDRVLQSREGDSMCARLAPDETFEGAAQWLEERIGGEVRVERVSHVSRTEAASYLGEPALSAMFA